MQTTTILDVKTITSEILAELLQNILKTDSSIVNQSTVILKKYFELPTCITHLLMHVTSNSNPNVRLLSCICLRKRLPQHWVAQPISLQSEIKSALLACYVNEPVGKVKENIAYVISSLSTILVPNNEWPELFNFIGTKCKSSVIIEKELGALLLFAVSEAIGNGMEPYLNGLIGILNDLILVPNQSIQKLAVKTLNCLISSNISSSCFAKLEGLIPIMLKPILEKMDDNEQLLQEIFENIIELIDIPKILTSQLSYLINAALCIAKNPEISTDLRKIVLCFIESAVQSKKTQFKKDKSLLQQILKSGYEIVCQSEEDYEKDEENPTDAALDMLDKIATCLPNTIIFPLIIRMCEDHMKSTEPLKRRAGLLILGTVSKGIRDPMTENIEEILTPVLMSMEDPSLLVQEAGVLALSYFSLNLSPEIVEYYQRILPVLLKAFSSKVEKIRNKCFYAIEMFCENLNDQEIQPYLHQLLECLVNYLDAPQIEIKRGVLMALASVLTAAQTQIIPYIGPLMEKLGRCLFSDEDELVRAKAAIAIGKLAESAGLELFKPYLEMCSKRILAEMQSKGNLYEMHEAGYSYFGDIVKLLGEQFTTMNSILVPMLIKSLNSSEGVKHHYAEKNKDKIQIAESDSDSENDEDLKGVSVRTAFLDEKVSALHALGRFAKYCPKGFLPFMRDSLEAMDPLTDYFHEAIRYQLVQSLQEFVEGINLAYFNGQHPKPIVGLPPKVKMCEDAEKLFFGHVLPKYFEILKEDEEREVVARVLESLCDLIKNVGPAIVGNQLTQYIECIMLLLNQKAACMQDSECECDCEDEEECKCGGCDSGDEEFDHDEILIVHLIELIQDIAKMCGNEVTPHYKQILDALVLYTKAPHPENDWVVAIGAFTELLRALPVLSQNYCEYFMRLSLKLCESGKNDLTRNAAYCLGIIVEHGAGFAEPYVMEILSALKSAFEKPKAQEPKDNAVSSLLRVFVAYPDKVPLELVLPAIFNNLPLNGDAEENNNIVRSFMLIKPEYMRLLEKYIEKILIVCFKVLMDGKCRADEELKGLVGMFINKIAENESVRLKIMEFTGKMNKAESEILSKYLK